MGSRSRTIHGTAPAVSAKPRTKSWFFGVSARVNNVQRSALRHGRCSHALTTVLRMP